MISSLVVTLVFAVFGWLIFRGFKAPKKGWIWILILLATIFAGYIGTSTILFSFPGSEVYLNDCLQGLGFGAIAGLAIKKR